MRWPDFRGAGLAPSGGMEAWHGAEALIENEGEEDPRVRVVASGWLGWCRTLPDGRRQVLHLLLPGDTCGLVGGQPCVSLAATVALTRAKVIDYGRLRDVAVCDRTEHRALAERISKSIRTEQPALIDQVVRLGRMSALERTAHLLLDLFRRLHRIGETQGLSMPFPLTQEVLSDHLGLSIVHMNRTLQRLRRDGLIEYRNSRVTLRDPEGLADVCGAELNLQA